MQKKYAQYSKTNVNIIATIRKYAKHYAQYVRKYEKMHKKYTKICKKYAKL